LSKARRALQHASQQKRDDGVLGELTSRNSEIKTYDDVLKELLQNKKSNKTQLCNTDCVAIFV
jgi:hypothetical protein